MPAAAAVFLLFCWRFSARAWISSTCSFPHATTASQSATTLIKRLPRGFLLPLARSTEVRAKPLLCFFHRCRTTRVSRAIVTIRSTSFLIEAADIILEPRDPAEGGKFDSYFHDEIISDTSGSDVLGV